VSGFLQAAGFASHAFRPKNGSDRVELGRFWPTRLPCQLFAPDLPVMLKTPPPVRPISASYVLTWTLTSSTASIEGMIVARLRMSTIATPSSV
jgi:hypothetical protein